jgi:hypothetical protein
MPEQIYETYFKIPILRKEVPFYPIKRIYIQFQVVVPENRPFRRFEVFGEETRHRRGDLIGTATTVKHSQHRWNVCEHALTSSYAFAAVG